MRILLFRAVIFSKTSQGGDAEGLDPIIGRTQRGGRLQGGFGGVESRACSNARRSTGTLVGQQPAAAVASPGGRGTPAARRAAIHVRSTPGRAKFIL